MLGGGGRGGDPAGSAPAVPGKWVSNTGGLTTPEKGGGEWPSHVRTIRAKKAPFSNPSSKQKRETDRQRQIEKSKRKAKRKQITDCLVSIFRSRGLSEEEEGPIRFTKKPIWCIIRSQAESDFCSHNAKHKT